MKNVENPDKSLNVNIKLLPGLHVENTPSGRNPACVSTCFVVVDLKKQSHRFGVRLPAGCSRLSFVFTECNLHVTAFRLFCDSRILLTV